MRYLTISVQEFELNLVCCLAKEFNILISNTKDLSDGTFQVKIGYLDHMCLFAFGKALGSYSPTFQLN